MALFKTDNCLSAYPQLVVMAGQFLVPTGSPTFNQQILPTSVGQPATPGGTAAGFYDTISPRGLRVNIFYRPTFAQPIPATNQANLPPAGSLPSGTGNVGEFLIDLSGFPAELVSANATYVPQTHGQNISAQADVNWTDPVNKLVYIQCYTQTTGAFVLPPFGNIAFQVFFKDTIGV